MDSVVTPNKTLDYGNDSPRTRKAIQQDALLIILTTTLYWAQPMKEWRDPNLYPVVPTKAPPVNDARPVS
jgi:hypothetical protein